MDSEGWTNVPTEIQICKANILHNPMEGETDLAKVSKDYKKIIESLDLIRETSTDIHGELIEALQEAGDIIADYEAAVAQTAELIRRYEQAEPAINRGMGYWQCPECQKRTPEGHSHCHWCGKALDWTGRRRR